MSDWNFWSGQSGSFHCGCRIIPHSLTQTNIFMTAQVDDCQMLHCTQECLQPTHRKSKKGGASHKAKVGRTMCTVGVYMPTSSQVLHSRGSYLTCNPYCTLLIASNFIILCKVSVSRESQCMFQNCMIAWRRSLEIETLQNIMKLDILKEWWLFVKEYSICNITAQSLPRETGCLGFRLSYTLDCRRTSSGMLLM